MAIKAAIGDPSQQGGFDSLVCVVVRGLALSREKGFLVVEPTLGCLDLEGSPEEATHHFGPGFMQTAPRLTCPRGNWQSPLPILH